MSKIIVNVSGDIPQRGTFWRLMSQCTEWEKGFIRVLLMEKLRDWYYTTPGKKNSIYPISNTKKKYTGYWEIALFGELPILGQLSSAVIRLDEDGHFCFYHRKPENTVVKRYQRGGYGVEWVGVRWWYNRNRIPASVARVRKSITF